MTSWISTLNRICSLSRLPQPQLMLGRADRCGTFLHCLNCQHRELETSFLRIPPCWRGPSLTTARHTFDAPFSRCGGFPPATQPYVMLACLFRRSSYFVSRAQGGPGGPAPHIPPGANIGQSVGNFKKNYRQVSPAQATSVFSCNIPVTCVACVPAYCVCRQLVFVFAPGVHHLA